jgi:hypothetical protein
VGGDVVFTIKKYVIIKGSYMKFYVEQDLYPWYKIFTALSLPQFELFWQKLKFPFYPTDELRQISYDFSYKYVISRNLRAQKDALNVIKLLENIEIGAIFREEINQFSSPASLKIYLQSAFNKTFVDLKKHNYKEGLYQWGVETYTYYKINDKNDYKNTGYLESWLSLFRRWAVAIWIVQEKPILPKWKTFFDYFTDVYRRSSVVIKENIPIVDDKTVEYILELIISNEVEKFKIEENVYNAFSLTKNAWEDFAVSEVNTWLQLELRHRINRDVWNEIMNTISSDDKNELQNWGVNMNIMHWPDW